jgi:hypothetical protein
MSQRGMEMGMGKEMGLGMGMGKDRSQQWGRMAA